MTNRIEIDPLICHGKPVIKGTRVMVSTLLGALSGGDTVDMILEDYPNVSYQDIMAALAFASELTRFEEQAYNASFA